MDLYHLGQSKKRHQIFRAKKWNENLERIFKKPIYNEKYEKVGDIKDIFGPKNLPFISIKGTEVFNPNDVFYTKI